MSHALRSLNSRHALMRHNGEQNRYYRYTMNPRATGNNVEGKNLIWEHKSDVSGCQYSIYLLIYVRVTYCYVDYGQNK